VRKDENGFAFLIASRRFGIGATGDREGGGSEVGNG
jgi:hypothetical protein